MYLTSLTLKTAHPSQYKNKKQNHHLFFFLCYLWTTHVFRSTKDKWHFQGSLQTFCSRVKQPVIKHWWCKFLHGQGAAPGASKCHFNTQMLTCFLKALCRSPAAHRDCSYVCLNVRPFSFLKMCSRTWHSALKISLQSWRIEENSGKHHISKALLKKETSWVNQQDSVFH